MTGSCLCMSKCLLEILNCLYGYPCKLHGRNKLTPGGMAALAFNPSDQPVLHCIFIFRAFEACSYCGCVKPHSFKNWPRFAYSVSAHMCSKEYEMVWTTCGESKTLNIHIPYK